MYKIQKSLNYKLKCENTTGTIIILCLSVVLAICVGMPLFVHRFYYLGSDSVGYFGIAATLAGKDWGDVLATVSSYSYGYALLLIPAFWIQKRAGDVLLYAAFLNTFLIVLSFIFTYKCISRFCQGKKAILYAFGITVYSGSISSSQYYGADVLLLTLFWMLLYLIIRFIDTKKIFYGIMVPLLGTLLYAAHQRALVIVAAIFILYIILVLDKKIDICTFFICLSVQILFLVVIKLGYSNFGAVFPRVTGGEDANSASTRWSYFVEEVFTIEFWFRTIKNIFRQFLYVGFSTLNVAIAPVIIWFFKLKCNRKERDIIFYLEGFIIAVLLMQIIMVVVMLNPTRVDMLGMGRYVDYIIPSLCMFWFIDIGNENIYQNKKKIVLFILMILNLVGIFCFQVDYKILKDLGNFGQGNYVGEAWIVDAGVPWLKVFLLIITFDFFFIFKFNNRSKTMGIIILAVYFLFCYIHAYPYIHDTTLDKEENYSFLADEFEEYAITDVYWPYLNGSVEMRHFQVFCSNLQFHCYLSDTAQYEGNENELFKRKSDVLHDREGSVYMMMEKDVEQIADKYNVKVIGQINGLVVAIVE